MSLLRSLKITSSVVPGGCTKYVQPADVCWIKPFKDQIRRCFDELLERGEMCYTRGGHPRAAPLDTVLQWISDSWQNVSSDLVKKSFKTCGVTNAPDGSEDNQIHCFSSNGDLCNGLNLLREEFLAEGLAGASAGPVSAPVVEADPEQSDSEAESVIDLEGPHSSVTREDDSDVTD